jgi:CRP-like cAMP-binding protein
MTSPAEKSVPPAQEKALEVLRLSFLFRDIPEDVLTQLLSYFETRSCQAEEPIFLEQEASEYVYVVLRGSVEIVKYTSQARVFLNFPS